MKNDRTLALKVIRRYSTVPTAARGRESMCRQGISSLLLTVLIGALAAGCGTTRQRVPGLACTALDPKLRLTQGFVAHGESLTSARILVKTLNRKWRRSEAITLTLLDSKNREIARATQPVEMGYRGWVEFDFPAPGVELCRGERYFLRAVGSRNLPFGWYHRQNFYTEGIAYQNGVARPHLDWYFKLVWATATEPYQVAAYQPGLLEQRSDHLNTTLHAATL
ncbi:MAG: hypothetical protein ISS31_07025 [Kiritimatiellae bacterium]|nr:hypothetical protein [Kiritimatiellia bacterium]